MRKRLQVSVTLLAVSALLAACSAGHVSSARRGSHPLAGGVAIYARQVGHTFSWIFPLPNLVNYDPWEYYTEEYLWLPLYYAGSGTHPIINYSMSLAYPPQWSDGDRVVTIRLKPYRWSDGVRVTTADVRFFFEIYEAGKDKIANYVPGEFPDNITKISYLNATTFRLFLNQRYSPQWYLGNQLTHVIPLPQHAWDKISPTSPPKNYAATPQGALAVFNYLYSQSEELSTYATNPLWKVVDGPWRLAAFDPVTYETTLVPNPSYSGPEKPHLSKVIFESFASSEAEVDALRSGEVDYGYIPISDYTGLAPYFRSHGYVVAPWVTSSVQWADFDYTNPVYGPLVRQLYIREALQHLVNEPFLLARTLDGLGQLTYGPVPNIPGSPYVSPQEKTDPDPFSLSAARHLLASHGWRKGASGVLVCQRPGSGPSDCGGGIHKGAPLALSLIYSSGYTALTEQVEYFATLARSVGVSITLLPEPETTIFSTVGICPPGPCNWGMVMYQEWIWNYGQEDAYPTGGQIFGKGAAYEDGGYWTVKDQQLIDATHTDGISALYAYENYISRQVAGLWFPTWDTRISVVKSTLGGWLPQQVFGNPEPQRWYWTASS